MKEMMTKDGQRLLRNEKASALEGGLAHFYGTENYFKHWTGRLVHTDGVQYLAEQAGGFWLVDAIASYQGERKLKSPGLQAFQLWELEVNAEAEHPVPMAVLTCRADTGRSPVVRQEIEYTDFPLDHVKLFVESGVLLLPNEH